MKKKSLSLFLLYSLLSTFVFGYTTKDNGDGDDKTMRIETSFFISPEVDVVITGSFNVPQSNTLTNEGKLHFINTEESNIILPSGDLGTGELVFSGNENYNLALPDDPSLLESLTVEMHSGTINLTGAASISNKLELKSGVLNVSKNSTLLINNTEPSSVVFSNTPINKSYISGYLTRKVKEGETYEFPVGNSTNFHPFLIDKPLLSDNISVAFDEGIASKCENYCKDNSIKIENKYGWAVESDSETRNEFIAGLSLLNTQLETKSTQLDIYYLSDIDYNSTIITSARNTLKSTQYASYITTENRNSYGFYAFSNLLDDELINFIYVQNGNKTNFEIPNPTDFSKIRFSVYNRLGSMIFKSDNYVSEFDARNYPDGTYYYELTLEKAGINKTIRNFIDIKHEN